MLDISFSEYTSQSILELDVKNKSDVKKEYLKIESRILINEGMSQTYLYTVLQSDNSVKQDSIRLFNPRSMQGLTNNYAFYVKVTEGLTPDKLTLYLKSKLHVSGRVEYIEINRLTK